jgi:hypothetical protein
MVDRLKNATILTAIGGVLLLALFLLSFSYVDVGVTEDFWSDGLGISDYELADIPQSMVDDATTLARELFGDNQDKYESFVNDLLATYNSSKDRDFIVLFNSGGWGWNQPEKSPGWDSILQGIREELDKLGYSSLVLNYRRTGESVWGRAEEFLEIVARYPSKARDLAYRVDFLTEHIPDARVIMAGESNGTMLADRAMYLLKDNHQVYTIQTGPPFWHRPMQNERSLILDSNGTGPDTFAQGDIPAMLWASIKSTLGIEQPGDREGTILLHLKAPGHDYSWGYTEIYERITRFLNENFGFGQS